MSNDQQKANRYIKKLQSHTGWWRATIAEVGEGPKGALVRIQETGENHPITLDQLKTLRDQVEGGLAGEQIDFEYGQPPGLQGGPSLPGISEGAVKVVELERIELADPSRDQKVEKVPAIDDVAELMGQAILAQIQGQPPASGKPDGAEPQTPDDQQDKSRGRGQ